MLSMAQQWIHRVVCLSSLTPAGSNEARSTRAHGTQLLWTLLHPKLKLHPLSTPHWPQPPIVGPVYSDVQQTYNEHRKNPGKSCALWEAQLECTWAGECYTTHYIWLVPDGRQAPVSSKTPLISCSSLAIATSRQWFHWTVFNCCCMKWSQIVAHVSPCKSVSISLWVRLIQWPWQHEESTSANNSTPCPLHPRLHTLSNW